MTVSASLHPSQEQRECTYLKTIDRTGAAKPQMDRRTLKLQ